MKTITHYTESLTNHTLHRYTPSMPHLKDTDAKYDKRFEQALSQFRWYKTRGYWRHVSYDPVVEKYVHRFSMHEKVWELAHGSPPKPPLEIDHINRDKCDNRLENLRLATLELQGLNKGPRRRKSDLPMGVYLTRGCYWTNLCHGGSDLYFGGFADPEDAGRVVAENRRRLIEYEAKRAMGENPPYPELVRGADRRAGNTGRPKKQKPPESFPAIKTIAQEPESVRELTFVPEGADPEINLEDLFQ